MFRYILVPATGVDADIPVFRVALAVALSTGGHLAFLHVRLDVQQLVASMAAGDVGGTAGIGDVLDRLEHDAAETEARAHRLVVEFCAEQRVALADSPFAERPSAGWRSVTGDEPRLIAAHSRTADLAVLRRRHADGGPDLRLMQTVLLDSGRPILIIPDRPITPFGRRIAIAWKDTPEAARAIAMTLPMLTAADRVTIISVEEDARTTSESCDRLRQALVWHKPAITVQHIKPQGQEPAEALLAAVAAQEADLLVMGGYSHSRLREVVFGGVTRRVLRAAEVPVLMAH